MTFLILLLLLAYSLVAFSFAATGVIMIIEYFDNYSNALQKPVVYLLLFFYLLTLAAMSYIFFLIAGQL